MSERKIVWVINQFAGNPESGWGERHFYFAKEWKKQGHEVVIISSTYNHMFSNFPSARETYNDDSYEGIRFCWIKTRPYNAESVMRFWAMLVFAFRSWFIPVKRFGKPNVIIVSSMPIFPVFPAYFLSRKFKAKLLFEIRDVWPMTLQSLKKISASHPLVRFIGFFEKFGYRKSDSVVTLLPNAHEHINRVAGRKVDVHYIPNGISMELLSGDELPEELRNRIPRGKFIVTYTGTLGALNAMEYFVSAAHLLQHEKNIHFLIVGDGYEKPKLVQQAAGLDNISFLGKIPKKHIQAVLAYSSVCYVGRHGYDLYRLGVSANKFFDYMLAGKPVISSNLPVKDPVELSGCGILVQPENEMQIADAVGELFRMDEDAKAEMGLRGRRFVGEHHNIAGLAEQYNRLF